MVSNNWYINAVFYEVSVQAFFDSNHDGYGDLKGLTQKLDYLKELGVDCLWLLPINPSPMRDGGYDIMEYCAIHPNFGALDDFRALIAAAHEKGLRVITDLVMNHTSEDHPWFQAARADRNSPFHDYYVWSEDDRKFKDAPIIFVDTEKSNWSWNEPTGEYYWHRFYHSQPDLNYDNPAVKTEMFKVVNFWLDLGVDGFRVDAVPYLIEREGSLCENLPETHAILKELREVVNQHSEGKVLICEANLWPEEVRHYLGDGDEFHMAFNFPLMPRVFLALLEGDAEPIRWALGRLPAIPPHCQWGTFLRNHDELTLALLDETDRQRMWQAYAPDKRHYSNIGIRRRLAPLLGNDQRKIELAFSMLLTLPGSPFLYYGDEIGMGDNVDLFDRDGLRTPMQWTSAENAGFSSAESLFAPVNSDPLFGPAKVNVEDQRRNSGSLWNAVSRMISARKAHPAFSSRELAWLEDGPDEVLAFWREDPGGSVLAVHNLGAKPVSLEIDLGNHHKERMTDLITGQTLALKAGAVTLELEAYQFRWLTPG